MTECSLAMATATAGNSIVTQEGKVSIEMEAQAATAARDDVDYVKLEEKVNHGCI